jgi:hypothetical protein
MRAAYARRDAGAEQIAAGAAVGGAVEGTAGIADPLDRGVAQTPDRLADTLARTNASMRAPAARVSRFT